MMRPERREVEDAIGHSEICERLLAGEMFDDTCDCLAAEGASRVLALFDRAPDTAPAEAADELRALSEAAAPGPWRLRYGTISPRGNEVWTGTQRVLHDADSLRDEDWKLIVAAVNHVRAALAAPPAPTTTDAAAASSFPVSDGLVQQVAEMDACPNCQTPWKCNGPHITRSTP